MGGTRQDRGGGKPHVSFFNGLDVHPFYGLNDHIVFFFRHPCLD